MSRRKWLCLDCKVDTGKINEHYMLKDEIWAKVHDSKFGMMCVGCVEKKLGRLLNSQDFHKCYLNTFAQGRSQRLSMRLGILS